MRKSDDEKEIDILRSLLKENTVFLEQATKRINELKKYEERVQELEAYIELVVKNNNPEQYHPITLQ